VSLASFLKLSEELDLDDFSELLDGFFEVCTTIVRQLEGSVISSVGGRVMTRSTVGRSSPRRGFPITPFPRWT